MSLFDCEVLKNAMGTFSNKIRLNIFHEKMIRLAFCEYIKTIFPD